MKKVFGVAVVLVLCLCLGCASALAADGSATIFVSEELNAFTAVESIVPVGNTLYIGTIDGVYTWTPDQEKAVLLDANTPISLGYVDLYTPVEGERRSYNRLIGEGDQLYGLNVYNGYITPLQLTPKGFVSEKSVALKWETLGYSTDGAGEDREIYGTVIQDGVLYLLARGVNYGSSNNVLYRYDLTSGARTILATTALTNIAGYKDGKLLGMLYDRANAWKDGKRLMPTLVTVDTATGDMETMIEYPTHQASGLVYNKGDDTAYFLSLGEIYGSAAGAPFEVVAYMPCTYLDADMFAAILEGGYYAAWIDNEKLVTRNVDAALKPKQVLRLTDRCIDDGTATEAYNAFMAAHPEIPVVFVPDDGNTMAQNMITGELGADIITLHVALGEFDDLRDKGYCYDLSQSQIVTNAINNMYPQFAEYVKKDESIYAIPRSIYGRSLAYSPYVLEKIGLTQEDLPKTYIELIDFAVAWVEVYGAENPEYTLFQYVTDIEKQLFQLMISEYIGCYRMAGEKLSFDTPVFHKLLAKLEEAMPVLSELNPEIMDGNFSITIGSLPTTLFIWDEDYIPIEQQQAAQSRYKPCLLSLNAGMEPTLIANMTIFVVNPNSPNTDAAITFLEFYLENMWEAFKIGLYPNENNPIQAPYYINNIIEAKANLADVEKRLAKVKDDDIVHLEALGDEMERLKEHIRREEEVKWYISSERIQAYRSVAPYMTLCTNETFFNGDSSETSRLMKRYVDGQLDAIRFAKELERLAQMIDMEQR